MRFPTSSSMTLHAPGLPSKIVLIASGSLLLSATMQLATAWIQRHNTTCLCSAGPSSPPSSSNFEHEYTWEGNDFPAYLPLDFGDPVALTTENSRHFFLDGPEADDEWTSVYPGEHLGFLHLGPQKRFFGLSMYHQIHCLNALRETINGKAHHHRRGLRAGALDEEEDADLDADLDVDDRSTTTKKRASVEAKRYHTSHCLNYLRETILCAADITLEPEIAPGADNVGLALGVTHVCRDWSKVHAFVERNDREWEAWRQSRGGHGGQEGVAANVNASAAEHHHRRW